MEPPKVEKPKNYTRQLRCVCQDKTAYSGVMRISRYRKVNPTTMGLVLYDQKGERTVLVKATNDMQLNYILSDMGIREFAQADERVLVSQRDIQVYLTVKSGGKAELDLDRGKWAALTV